MKGTTKKNWKSNVRYQLHGNQKSSLFTKLFI